jgi:hypothetical protein
VDKPSRITRTSARRKPGDFRQWSQLVRNLPDLRWDKVARIREALRRNSYDADSLLDAALEPLGHELGVLARN